MAEYEQYRFTTEFEVSWLSFLRKYFEKTMRDVSSDERDDRRFLPLSSPSQQADARLDEDLASLVYSGEGLLDHADALATKGDPTDKMGGEQESASIKNYPRDTRRQRARGRQARKPFPLTTTFPVLSQNGNNGNGNHS